MPKTAPPAAFLVSLGLLVPTAFAGPPQGFVERASEVGLVHELATGFDEIGNLSLLIPDVHLVDWAQRGLAVADFDGDGDPDVVAAGGVLPNTVLRNDGGLFTDVTAAAGIEVGAFDTAPALADFDLDGDLDLYIGVLDQGSMGGVVIPGRGRMYRNLGGGVFEEISTLAGAPGGGYTIFSQWVDLDSDGLLDLALSEFYNAENRFYRNNGDGTFTDVGADLGLDSHGSTHVTGAADGDQDGVLDLFVGNDWGASTIAQLDGINDIDKFYRGQKDAPFLDISAGSGADQLGGIMGLAFGDVNYDGRLDMYKTDLGENRMVVNFGYPAGPPWTEEAAYYGVEAHPVPDPETSPPTNKAVGWGAVFLDVDFDLWLDLFTVNGQVGKAAPYGQRNFLWTGDGPGAGFTLTDRTAEFGLYDEIDDRCLAVGDYDADGDLDLIVAPTSGFLRYFENQVDRAGQGWLAVRPVCGTSAPGGFGVMARFTDSLGYPHVRQIGLDGNTASQNENLAYFGLGDETAVDLEVEFPSGLILTFPATAPNQTVVAVEPELVRPSARTLPIGPSPIQPGSNRQPTPVAPADLYAVSAFAHDASGNPLDETATVTIETPGLVAVSGVLHVQGNEFRRYFRAPVSPGAYRTEVTFDGWTVKIRPRIHFFDPSDTSGTEVAVRPAAVRAGSTDTFEVVVAPKTDDGLSLGPGLLVNIDVPGATALSGTLDLGDGRYRATFEAPAVTGLYGVSVSKDGVPLAAGAELEAAGVADPAVTDLHLEPPDPLASANRAQYRLLLTPRDAAGRRLGPMADVEVTAVPTAGSVSVRGDLYPFGQRDGDFPVLVQKPDFHSVSGVLEVRVDGQLLGVVPYAF